LLAAAEQIYELGDWVMEQSFLEVLQFLNCDLAWSHLIELEKNFPHALRLFEVADGVFEVAEHRGVSFLAALV